MRVAIDAMGGDLAPAVPVRGALAARDLLGADDEIILIGDESAIRPHLDGQAGWEQFIRVKHADEVIRMDESPVEALRQKPNSSIARMVTLAAAGEANAVISAGNTGACVAACQMRLRRLRGVIRPGIAIVVPTYHGPVVMCDVGANVNCRPRHLYQYALMASEYSRCICGVDAPRVALLSIGQEDAKGSPLVKDARELLRDDPKIRFVGNCEGRDLFHGACDVIVCEAFVGNVALKLMEGLADGLFKSLLKELADVHPNVHGELGGLIAAIRDRFDFNEYGGAPLLGVNGICIICHGASESRAITNAVRVAIESANSRVNDRITDRLAQCQGTVHE